MTTVDGHPNESEQRRAIDQLCDFALITADDNPRLIPGQERATRMQGVLSGKSPVSARFFPDGIICLSPNPPISWDTISLSLSPRTNDQPATAFLTLMHGPKITASSAFWNYKPEQANLTIPVLFREFNKEDENTQINQLRVDMSTAFLQLKALGLN